MNKNKFFIPFFVLIISLLLSTSVIALTAYASPTKFILNGDIGKSFQRHVLIKNTNDVPVNIVLSSPYSNIKLSQTNFRLNPDANQTIAFNVTINHLGEASEYINVNFIPDNGAGATASVELDLNGNSNYNPGNELDNPTDDYQDVLISADLDPITPKIVEDSDMIIDVELKNTGDVLTEYLVSAHGYEGWGEVLAINPETITIEPGESKIVLMHFHINKDVTLDQEYMIQVNYGDNFKEEPVSFTVNPKFDSNLTDIAYVVRNAASPDYNFINVMNTLGFNYDLISSSSVSTTDFSNYKMILLGDERISNVPVNNYKSLIANPDYYKNFSQSKATTTRQNLYNVNQNISITQGIQEYFNAYVQNGISLYYLTGTKYSSNRVTTMGNSTVDKGRFVIATKNNPRRVFFGITKSSYWTDESLQLFMNSMDWLINGEDADSDGFMSDYDCNDSNPGVWRNVLAYVDSDSDGYGTGAFANVCIGNNLPSGYSYINRDCNDNNANIHPNSLEIPYNSVDEKCIGYDLGDVDNDLYCKAGYVIQNAALQCPFESGTVGTDCNDLDSSINPGSSDIFKNCINDLPIITDIESISVNEGEDVVINVDAIDPEDDILTYSINDSRFIKDNNIFTWATSYNDLGEYIFEISVNDGSLTTIKNVEVEVRNKNRAPVCSEIPLIDWDENKNTTLDLSNYCMDPDGDTINYEYYDTSDTNLNVDINGSNGIISAARYWYGLGWIQIAASDGEDDILTNIINISVNHINQEPEFTHQIENINIYEDINATNVLNLNNYFTDIDNDSLVFDVSPVLNIVVRITRNGIISFFPEPGYVGNQSIIFSASDGEFSVNSNEISLNVLYVNKPPKFGEVNCQTGILENNLYNCELNASDIENDSFSFSVVNEDNLNCEVSGNNLSYIGETDYYGNASCTIRVSDATGYSDLVLNTEIEHVNQPPRIYSYSPNSNSVKLLENSTKEFRVYTRDVDSNVTVNWILGNETIGTGNIFSFRNVFGNYNLTAVVSDEEFNSSNSWDIFVGAINDFKCSEVGGHLCSTNHSCNGNILGVYDTANCCSITCSSKPLEFINIKRETNITSGDTKLNIVKPLNGAMSHTGDKISIELKIDNDVYDSVDFDVYVYLYDVTKQTVVGKASDSLKINQRTTKTINPEIEVSRKINESDEFYIFAKIEGKNGRDKYYDDEYTQIDITRRIDDVVIENVEIESKDLLCGDDIHMTVKVRNYGTKSEDVYIYIQSPGVKISQQTPDFTIDGYDDLSNGDTIIKEINMKIDDKAEAGNYSVKTSVYFAGVSSSVNTEIILGECKALETETTQIETINSPGIKLESIAPKNTITIPNKGLIVLISTVSMLIIFVLVLISGKIYRRKMTAEREEYVQDFIKNIKLKRKRIL